MKNDQTYGEELDQQFEEAISFKTKKVKPKEVKQQTVTFENVDSPELEKGSFGTAGLVCGILGFIFLPIIFSPLAIIFGVFAMDKKQRYGHESFALGIIGLVLMVIMIFHSAVAWQNTFVSLFGK